MTEEVATSAIYISKTSPVLKGALVYGQREDGGYDSKRFTFKAGMLELTDPKDISQMDLQLATTTLGQQVMKTNPEAAMARAEQFTRDRIEQSQGIGGVFSSESGRKLKEIQRRNELAGTEKPISDPETLEKMAGQIERDIGIQPAIPQDLSAMNRAADAELAKAAETKAGESKVENSATPAGAFKALKKS